MALVIAFGFLFREEHLEAIPLGMVNVHFSLLPLYRGASPVQSALLNGDKNSGITWQKMVRELDAGPIIKALEYPLGKTATTNDLWTYFAKETAISTPDILWNYSQAPTDVMVQDGSLATFCGKFIKEDGAIDPKIQTAEEIYRKWRAFQPWPGIYLESSKIKLIRITEFQKHNSLVLECATNTVLYVQEIQVPGKKAAKAIDVWNGKPGGLEGFRGA